MTIAVPNYIEYLGFNYFVAVNVLRLSMEIYRMKIDLPIKL